MEKSNAQRAINFKSELGKVQPNGYKLFLQDSHSSIHFSITRQYPFNEQFTTSALAYFLPNKLASYDTAQRIYLDVGQVKVSTLNIPKDQRDAYPMFSPTDVEAEHLANLQGTQVNFEIAGNTSNGYPAFSHRMYIPKPLEISFAHPRKTTAIHKSYITRDSGFRLKWTADDSNENGVLIRINGNHKVDSVGNLLMNTELNSQTNIILASDDGLYTFTPADFNGIPDGVELLITVIRGNVAIKPIGEKTIKLYGREEVFVNTFLLMP